MITNKSIIRLGFFGLLAFAIAGTPTLSQAQSSPTDTTTNAVKTVKHKKKKAADTNAPATTATAPVAAPAAPATTTTPKAAPAATATTTTATTATGAGHNKSGVLPIHGKLKAVDTAAMTITLGAHTYMVTSETIITKNGNPATLADGAVGDDASGSYKKTSDGKLVLVKLRFGAKVAPETGGTK